MIKMRSALLLSMAAFFSFSTAQAWTCEVSCSVVSSIVHDTIDKKADNDDREDFNATCRQVYNGLVSWPLDCSYVVCHTREHQVEKVSGWGFTLSEARKSARESCQSKNSPWQCGENVTVTVGEYNCTN